ncbi:Sporulation kinase D [bacterium HR39]|nr:Sporulation kinase D [bacterium HR39]
MLDTLRRQGDDPGVRAEAIAILERGLADIAGVVRATLVAYREDREARPLTPEALDDLRLLIRHEAERRRLRLAWENRLDVPVPVAAGSLRQALLNLLLNACRAAPVGGRVRFSARPDDDRLVLEVADDGAGLPDSLEPALLRPDEAVPRRGQGLGLWIAGRLLADLGARVSLERPEEGGTRVVIVLPVPAAVCEGGDGDRVGTAGGGAGGG